MLGTAENLSVCSLLPYERVVHYSALLSYTYTVTILYKNYKKLYNTLIYKYITFKMHFLSDTNNHMKPNEKNKLKFGVDRLLNNQPEGNY